MSLATRLRAALVDALLWAALLDGVLWALTWNDTRVNAQRGVPVPQGLFVLALGCSLAVLAVAVPAAVAWWRGRPSARGWTTALAFDVLVTSHGWGSVPHVDALEWVSYGLGAAIALSTLPVLWGHAAHLGLGRRRVARLVGEFALLMWGFMVAPSAAMGIEAGLLHTRDLALIGQTGWQLLLPAAATCVALLAVATHLARGKPVEDVSRD